MNPTDIFEALEAIAKAPFDPAEFGFSFAEATDNAQATVSKLRGGSASASTRASGSTSCPSTSVRLWRRSGTARCTSCAMTLPARR